MIIDCHVHVPDCGMPRLLKQADAFGIERMCVFGLGNEVDDRCPSPTPHWPATGAPHHTDNWSPPAERVTASNQLVERLVGEVPDRLFALCFVNPREGANALSQIRRHVENGCMLGIKLWISCRANDPLVEPIAALAVELDVPILQHCWNKFGGNLPGESSTRDVAELAEKFPGLKIIAPHISGHGEAGILDLAPHPNVFVDTSGMLPDAGILEFAIKQCGVERVLFGSDAPLRHPGSALGRILGTALSPEDRSLILGGNFRRLFAV